jgi:hypothetical protein
VGVVFLSKAFHADVPNDPSIELAAATYGLGALLAVICGVAISLALAVLLNVST